MRRYYTNKGTYLATYCINTRERVQLLSVESQNTTRTMAWANSALKVSFEGGAQPLSNSVWTAQQNLQSVKQNRISPHQDRRQTTRSRCLQTMWTQNTMPRKPLSSRRQDLSDDSSTEVSTSSLCLTCLLSSSWTLCTHGQGESSREVSSESQWDSSRNSDKRRRTRLPTRNRLQ